MDKIEQIKNAFIETFNELLPMFELEAPYAGDCEIALLESACPANVVVGFTEGLSGNIVLGLDLSVATRIVAGMMDGMEITEFDLIAKSSLVEFMNMIMGTMVTKLNSSSRIEMTPPTLVLGKRIFLMISRVKTYKLEFAMGGSPLYISFSIE